MFAHTRTSPHPVLSCLAALVLGERERHTFWRISFGGGETRDALCLQCSRQA